MPSNAMWDEFCDQLRQAGQVLLDEAAPRDDLDQAEGVRYLIRLLRYATINNVEHADPAQPAVTNALDPQLLCKIGADNPDNIYMRMNVSGQHRYRISGKRGTVPLLTFGSKANRYHIDGTMASTGELHGDDLHVDEEGRFSFTASVEPPASGAWLPLAPDTTNITGRQSFQDRANEVPAQVRIELLDEAPAATPLDPATFAERLGVATAFVQNTSQTFSRWTKLFMQRPNELPDWGQEMFNQAGGDPTIFYLHGYWRLEPGQAWVVDTQVPDCDYWNFVLQNWWMESLDPNGGNIHVNNHTAKLNDDGTVTIVVADQDPGFGNWIGTGGHSQGTALLRWVKATNHPIPQCRVIDLNT